MIPLSRVTGPGTVFMLYPALFMEKQTDFRIFPWASLEVEDLCVKDFAGFFPLFIEWLQVPDLGLQYMEENVEEGKYVKEEYYLDLPVLRPALL
ncbi:MAG TPA: hypothetical protein DDW86_03590 [Clostridiales bacterium]|jgi:hypothetical protein|nr:hypothetical protein [Clostridiales bacterium]